MNTRAKSNAANNAAAPAAASVTNPTDAKPMDSLLIPTPPTTATNHIYWSHNRYHIYWSFVCS